jgi:hypothetical protein
MEKEGDMEKGEIFRSENEGEDDLSVRLSVWFRGGVYRCGFVGASASVVPWWPKDTRVEKEMGRCLKHIR